MAVVPGERCDTVAELRAQDSPTKLMVLATVGGVVVGSGMADRSETAGGGFAAARVPEAHRRQGIGTALVRHLAGHCTDLGLPLLKAGVEDDGSLAFAQGLGFVEVDREVEQVRTVGVEPEPSPLPDGVSVVTSSDQPDLWAASYDRFGTEVLADFATYSPLEISAAQWSSSWEGDPMFLAVHDGEVVGCAGLHRDTDQPERGENALTAVRRDWRGTGIASHLKRRTLQWASQEGLTELYTWTQAGNASMLRLNEHLGYTYGAQSITLSRPLPLD